MGTGAADGLSDGLSFVASEVVEHDDVAGLKRGDEGLFHPGSEQVTVDSAVQHHRRFDPFMTQGGDEGEDLTGSVRNLGQQPFSAPGPAVSARP